MKAVFDTNILIDYLKGVDAAEAELGRYRERYVSAVTWMEVLIGSRSEAETDVIGMFLRDFKVIDISRRVSRETIDVRRTYRLRLPDAIIWASARVESALLVTRNRKDYPADDPGVRFPY
jgi:hypothetical protein